MSTTSLLQTALQNLHVSQQTRDQSSSPLPRSPRLDRSPQLDPAGDSDNSAISSDGEDDSDELVQVGRGTRPATPLVGQKGLVLGQRVSSALGGKSKDPVGVFAV